MLLYVVLLDFIFRFSRVYLLSYPCMRLVVVKMMISNETLGLPPPTAAYSFQRVRSLQRLCILEKDMNK